MVDVPIEGKEVSLAQSRMLSLDEVMKFLKISKSSLYRLMRRSKHPIPTVKLGKHRRYPLDKVRSWIEGLER